jgi:APA family basic amino acid/polyamine antiporter
MWGDWARYLVAGGAVMSTFGALNGYIIMQGQIPAAAAAGKVFPAIFKKENKAGSPVVSIVGSSVLISALLLMNFHQSLANTYQFIILLSTMTVLVPYLFSAVSYVVLAVKSNQLKWNNGIKITVAILAFAYSLWAVAGSGQESVYWGFMLLMIGVPLYGWSKIKRD